MDFLYKMAAGDRVACRPLEIAPLCFVCPHHPIHVSVKVVSWKNAQQFYVWELFSF